MRALVDVERVVELTTALVAVDSRNPPGREREAGGVCRDALARWDPSWTEIEPDPGRLSLIAEIPHPEGPGTRPTLIINGHLDVVPVDPRAWTHDPFRAERHGDRLYGRGTADMKGGIAAAIAALEVVQRAGKVPACNVVFHLVADEETGGQLGTRALLEAGLITGDACLIPEPTSMQLCVAERGLLQGHITVHGRPGHGSQPRQGVSAIEHAAAIVGTLHAADFGDPEHSLLGRPTANIGTIEGGNGLNVVAETCVVGVDRRLLPGATEASARCELLSKVDALSIADLRYDFAVKVFGEASEMATDHPFASLVGAAVAAATGSAPSAIGMPFTTDARFVRNQAGIPAVVCGPGEIACAHIVDEWVSVERLGDATAAYAHLITSFGPQQNG